MGGFNFQRPESSQLSIGFCPAVLRQISHCWEDSTHTHKLSCTCNMLQPERFFPPALLQKGCGQFFPRFVIVSTVCARSHQEPQQCLGGWPWAGLSPVALLSKKLPGLPVLGQAQPLVLREPKASPRAFPSHLGWSSWASHRTSVWSLKPSPGTGGWLSCRVKHPKAQVKPTPVQNWAFPLPGCP